MKEENQFPTASSCRKSYAKPSMTMRAMSVSSMIATSPGGTIGTGDDIPIEGAPERRSFWGELWSENQ